MMVEYKMLSLATCVIACIVDPTSICFEIRSQRAPKGNRMAPRRRREDDRASLAGTLRSVCRLQAETLKKRFFCWNYFIEVRNVKSSFSYLLLFYNVFLFAFILLKIVLCFFYIALHFLCDYKTRSSKWVFFFCWGGDDAPVKP